ncbi:MAG TPA: DUF456 domain-containing protein [Verrucomicrobiales bacterium]|nr:DUF456 domain-containing protein [Verrucomicrobiales bacterium]
MLELWIGFGVMLLVMLIGLFGNLIPGVPGTSLIFVGALVHRLYFGDAGGMGWFWLILMGFLMLLSFLIDYVASLLGAKKFGASWRGVLGAFFGIIGGLVILPPLGLIIGAFVGAMGFEWAFGRETRDAAKAGFGAALGMMLGMVGSAMCGAVMMGIFLIAAFPNEDVLPALPEVEAAPADTLTHEPKDDSLSVKFDRQPIEPVEMND